jgi:hypothetical protein
MRENLRFCDEVFLGITNRTDEKIVVSAYSLTEKTIVLVYQTVGLIGNMGLAGFLSDEYDSDPGYGKTIHAFERIGDRTMTETLAEAINIYQSQTGMLPESDEYAKLSAALDKLDDVCIDNEDRTIDLLAKFIKENHCIAS